MKALPLPYFSPRLIWAFKGDVPGSGRGHNFYSSHYSAWFMVRGECVLSFENGEEAKLEEGYWGIPSPLFKRSQDFTDNAVLLSIRFRLGGVSGIPPASFRNFVVFRDSEYPKLKKAAIRLVRLFHGYLADLQGTGQAEGGLPLHAEVDIQGAFLNWLSLWLEIMSKAGIEVCDNRNIDGRVMRMLNKLRSSSSHGSVPYDELGKISSLGRVQIDRLFKSQVGASPKQIKDNYLLESCKDMLLAANLTVKELADTAGFQTASQFCTWFKKHTGVSPMNYRVSEIHR